MNAQITAAERNEARVFAYEAHAGQVDKAGRPYIEHVARVAAAVEGDYLTEAVAWLHDVLEDCPKHRTAAWNSFSFSIMWNVRVLTRDYYWDRNYYGTIKRHPVALKVKLADIADNADEFRLALLGEETATRLRAKYARALHQLSN